MRRAGSRFGTVATDVLKPALAAIRPEAGWVEEDQEMIALPSGEWWAVDPLEGGVNYVHGSDEWAVTEALIRDNAPVLAVVFEPVTGRTWTAVRDGGAFLNARPLKVPAKQDVGAALVTTTQPRTRNREFGNAVAGALLVAEAGGVVIDLRGVLWQPGATDILAAAPGVHQACAHEGQSRCSRAGFDRPSGRGQRCAAVRARHRQR
jgi:myo-inositol-1(or 4)-monophosphatase